MPHIRTNWHEAITSAIQIDLKDYSHLLEYHTEHFLSSNKNRIDLLVIKKQSDFFIPKHIACIFRTHNLFEIKGLNSSLTTDTYYKTNGHAGYYINAYPGSNFLDRREVTLTFPTFHYPAKLLKHLTKDCQKTIANPFSGVYYIDDEMYPTQILVIRELLPEDSLYLYCLNENLKNLRLVDRLAEDYSKNKNSKLHTSYMNQFFYSHKKGEHFMVCEGLLNYFGTSSEEIAQKTREQDEQYYRPQIEKLSNTVDALTSKITQLEQLLAKNNISY